MTSLYVPTGGPTTTAEQTTSFGTKQILGYLWPVPLLRKHGRDVPKKLQTVTHGGVKVKGQILEEFAIGFLENNTISHSKSFSMEVGVVRFSFSPGPNCLRDFLS